MSRIDAIRALRFAHRRLRRMQVVGLFTFVVSFAVGSSLFWQATGNAISLALSMLVAMCYCAGAMLIQAKLDVRFRRRKKPLAEAAGYRLCPTCAYDASHASIVETHEGTPRIRCSECGDIFDPEATSPMWRIYLS